MEESSTPSGLSAPPVADVCLGGAPVEDTPTFLNVLLAASL
tara:strand:- start:834 stop:956 length:123 start_codon:yes stop_codon:yes gene_type:complete